MLKTLSKLVGSTVTATDGLIGHVTAAFFDDQSWAIRYLVVDTGTWLSRNEVLISPYSIRQMSTVERNIDVALTKEQVKASPDIDTHKPVSRQHETEFLGYYAYPEYWAGGGIWGMDSYPMIPPMVTSNDELATIQAKQRRDKESADVHLRSSVAITGYNIHATDDSIGHVQDFIFDEQSWVLRYFVVDTRNWLPGGRKVLVGNHWIKSIDWDSSSVHVSLTREEVKTSPEYDESQPVERSYEQRLADVYKRQGYWDM